MEEIDYLQLAINKAWEYQFLTYPNPAVGACVVHNNTILSVEAHKEAGKPHAEVLALKVAFLTKYPNSPLKDLENSSEIHNYLYENHNDFFKECEIYVTLEPCNHTGKTPACAILLEKVGIKKAIIGTLDPNKTASGGKERLKNAGIEVSVLNDENSYNLLLPFIKWQEKNFKFFKLAIREDGSCDGGYITTQDSLSLVHEIRTKLDLLAIGGKTVRVDRPTLDARFAKENIAPNVLIYSSKKEFNKKIPLFDVPNRKVTVSNNLQLIEKNNFTMIEGGYKLLDIMKDKIDMLMLFISHKEKKEHKFDIKRLGFKEVHSYFINTSDEIIFLKK